MKRYGAWLRFAITLALIGWVLHSVNLKDAAELVRRAKAPVVIAAVLIAFADRALMFAKWFPLLRIQVPGVGWWPAARVYMASSFAAMFMPGVAADLMRGVALGRDRKAIPEIGASIAAERILGMLGLSVLTTVSLVLVWDLPIDRRGVVSWAIIATLVPLVLAAVASVATRVSWMQVREGAPSFPFAGTIRRFGAAYAVYRDRPATLAVVWIASILEQTMPIWIFSIIAVAIGGTVEPWMLWIAVPLTLFAARMPFTLWGLGIAEGGMIYLLGLVGVPAHEALALSLTGRLIELVTILPGGFFWGDLVRLRTQRVGQD